MLVRLVSWNIAKSQEAWKLLAADGTLDLALVQEAVPPGVELEAIAGTPDWRTAGGKRSFAAAIACLSQKVSITQIKTVPLADAGPGVLGVSRPGTVCAAHVEGSGVSFTAISAYAAWDYPFVEGGEIWADGSAHRILSDISPLLALRRSVVLAGDWNILHGYGERGSSYWAERYKSFFDRVRSLGLVFVGPQYPNGARAEPWPEELPQDSRNVPTYRRHQADPTTAARQMDFVFVSAGLAEATKVEALNCEKEWGPSDHCQISIEIDFDQVEPARKK